jgi:hypothetical protein
MERFYSPVITFRTLGKGLGDDISNEHRILLTQSLEERISALLTSQQLQLEVTLLLNKQAEEVYRLISDTGKLVEWGSGCFKARFENPDQTGVGSTRIINEGLMETRELIREMEYPLFAYAQTTSIAGYENHFSVIACLPVESNESMSYLVQRVYATETGSMIGTFCGFNSMKHFLVESSWNLKKIIDDANRLWNK